MKNIEFDVTYLDVDSIQEGVGSSQTIPLILGLAKKVKMVCLITFEKCRPSKEMFEMFSRAGIVWIAKEFGKPIVIEGLMRFIPSARAFQTPKCFTPEVTFPPWQPSVATLMLLSYGMFGACGRTNASKLERMGGIA